MHTHTHAANNTDAYTVLKVLGKSVGLCKTTKRKDQLHIVNLFLYGESSVKISTQMVSY